MLSNHERRFLSAQRVGYLATADNRAIPHVVPVCFTISQGTVRFALAGAQRINRLIDPQGHGEF
jgi:nitroimidazol reductase NimA-like FMN-containing flavoprotein (pyridoxamine 5'-phosphate oxidase superfamily)